MYQKIAQNASLWNQKDNVGLVVGATKPEQIADIRLEAGDIPFLIPGIGAQGGDLEASVSSGNTNGIALINVSRGGVVNENDLYLHVKNKRIFASATDVYLHENMWLTTRLYPK